MFLDGCGHRWNGVDGGAEGNVRKRKLHIFRLFRPKRFRGTSNGTPVGRSAWTTALLIPRILQPLELQTTARLPFRLTTSLQTALGYRRKTSGPRRLGLQRKDRMSVP